MMKAAKAWLAPTSVPKGLGSSKVEMIPARESIAARPEPARARAATARGAQGVLHNM